MMPKFQLQKMQNGLCCIIASVLVSGCATNAASRNITYDELNHFVVDCSIKEEQIRFLNSQRMTANEKMAARFQDAFVPFLGIFAPDMKRNNHMAGSGSRDFMMRQVLQELARCPDKGENVRGHH